MISSALNNSLGRCEQTVAWIDCTKQGARIGLGVYTRANWSETGALEPHRDRALAMPIEAPWFQRQYRSRDRCSTRRIARPGCRAQLSLYSSFFYPLDGLQD